ncbi:MAG: hypothetical protein JJU23_08290 [Cyclobacteriaceae bacterium]|nr:hypothetical protein [Cyclobacteriaceae bacterium]
MKYILRFISFKIFVFLNTLITSILVLALIFLVFFQVESDILSGVIIDVFSGIMFVLISFPTLLYLKLDVVTSYHQFFRLSKINYAVYYSFISFAFLMGAGYSFFDPFSLDFQNFGIDIIYLFVGIGILHVFIDNTLYFYIKDKLTSETSNFSSLSKKEIDNNSFSFFKVSHQPSDILINVSSEDFPYYLRMVMQIPLVDKIEELETITFSDPNRKASMNYAIKKLKKLNANALPYISDLKALNEVDDILLMKAIVRLALINKKYHLIPLILNDSRPELKKAVIRILPVAYEKNHFPLLVEYFSMPEFTYLSGEAIQQIGSEVIPYLRAARYRDKGNNFFLYRLLELLSEMGEDGIDFTIELLNENRPVLSVRSAIILSQNYNRRSQSRLQISFNKVIADHIANIAYLKELVLRIRPLNPKIHKILLNKYSALLNDLVLLLTFYVPKKNITILQDGFSPEGGFSNKLAAVFLCDLYLPVVINSKIKKLILTESNKSLAKVLQADYPNKLVLVKAKTEKEVLGLILKSEIGIVGECAKEQALRAYSPYLRDGIPLFFVSFLYEKDFWIQELAFRILYKYAFDHYLIHLNRLDKGGRQRIKSFIEPLDRPSATDRYELMQMLRKNTPWLADSDEELLKLKPHIQFEFLNPISKKDLRFSFFSIKYVLIILKGTLTISSQFDEKETFEKGDVVDMSFLLDNMGITYRLDHEGEVITARIEYLSFMHIIKNKKYHGKVIKIPKFDRSLKMITQQLSEIYS